MKSGYYSNGKLNLTITNTIGAEEAIFYGTIAATETEDREGFNVTQSLSGELTETIELDIDNLFDVGISLAVDSQPIPDLLYLADGPWALDYDSSDATIDNYEVAQKNVEYKDNTYHVERNPIVSGQVKGTMNLFRHIMPGDLSLDVSEYENLEFSINTSRDVEVIILPEGVSWDNRLSYTIVANDEATFYSIPFTDFESFDNSISISNIKTILFSIKGNQVDYAPFTLKVDDVAFTQKREDTLSQPLNTQMVNYPNPFSTQTSFASTNDISSLSIKVYDMRGVLVNEQHLRRPHGRDFIYDGSKLSNGIYFYRLIDDVGKTYQGKFIISK
ncbi:T9SS type A sorting domain-containing protein [Winogradskyella sp. 3972H.M.0a.05]|uniref:T9SS type A sorting domain-containing protein n=1 Tax=Winogradskyella sp. 3972H.M.0a.05 TaxID=2950277 RepID=UPI003391650C